MHGPVCRSIWDYYKDESTLNSSIDKIEDNYILSISKEQEEIILDVLDEYGDKTGYYLECLTHSELPWQQARKNYCPSDRCNEGILLTKTRGIIWLKENKFQKLRKKIF